MEAALKDADPWDRRALHTFQNKLQTTAWQYTTAAAQSRHPGQTKEA